MSVQQAAKATTLHFGVGVGRAFRKAEDRTYSQAWLTLLGPHCPDSQLHCGFRRHRASPLLASHVTHLLRGATGFPHPPSVHTVKPSKVSMTKTQPSVATALPAPVHATLVHPPSPVSLLTSLDNTLLPLSLALMPCEPVGLQTPYYYLVCRSRAGTLQPLSDNKCTAL